MADGKPGAPLGNKNNTKNKLWDDALRRAITQDDGKRLRRAAETLLDKAAEGEAWAVRELADRLDGKATQAIANEDGSPLLSGIAVTLVKPS
jgi:hypothetical protein